MSEKPVEEARPNEARLIDREQVRYIADLIRLALAEEEVELFSEQLSTIVDYFNRLAEVDVEGAPPYRQPQMPRDRLREDVTQPSMARETFLLNAPQQQEGYVRVPVVLDVPGEEPDEGEEGRER